MTPHWNEMQSPALKQSLHLSVHLRNLNLSSWQKELGPLIYLGKKKKESCTDPTFNPNLETFIKGIKKGVQS